jgi:pyruvate kinase
MNVARLNFSHGTHEEHRQLIENIRIAAREEDRTVAILQDLQGPKIRIGEVQNGEISLEEGDRLILTTEEAAASRNRVHIDYPTLPADVSVGSRILIDDGLIELSVTSIDPPEVATEVIVGGPLRPRKGVNLPHIKSTNPALTEKDVRDLEFGLEIGVDIIALSFVRSPSDIRDLKKRIREAGSSVGVIAKIEKPEAVTRFDEILKEVTGIMVARGDLGIEMPLSQVPNTQKMIIHKCLKAAKPVITATQMLESMIDNPRPTRAEASDVANAVLDGSDAVMLSGETAVGKYPVRVVEVMDEIVMRTEEYDEDFMRLPQLTLRGIPQQEQVTEAISYTACQLAEEVNSVAIACLTHSGATARAISRHRPAIPVYAFTDQEQVVRELGLVWGTQAYHIPAQSHTDAGVDVVHSVLKDEGIVDSGDQIVITAGMPLPRMGRTNMVHVSRIH